GATYYRPRTLFPNPWMWRHCSNPAPTMASPKPRPSSVLYVISSGSFNLATVAKVEPCAPAIRRRTTETTRQFIERSMRENHGYTVPQRWLADLDAIPDGDTGEPQSGYLVGSTPL